MNELQNITSNALAKFDEARKQIQLLANQCQKIVISDEKSLESAKNLAITAKKVETLIEEKRKEITAPILAHKKSIDDYAKAVTNELSDALKDLRMQILNYEKKLAEERAAEQKRIAEERKRLESELREKALAGQTANLEKESVKLAELKEMEASQPEKSSSLRYVWDYEVVEFNQVPVSYMSIDDKKIKNAISAGVREIPGIKIFQKEQLHLRS